jgi:ketosteroid isomerase-like protein
MSEQDVEVVGAAIEAFNRESRDLDTARPRVAARFFVDEPEIVPLRAVLEGTTFKGPTALDDFFDATKEAWSDLRIDVERIEEEGAGVLVVATLVGTGRESRAVVEAPQAWAFFLQEGRIARAVTHPNEQDARRELRGEH